MFARMTRAWRSLGFALLALHCGSDDSARWSEASDSNEWSEPNPPSEAPGDALALRIEQRTQDQITGQFLAGDRTIEFASTRSAPFAGDVTIGAGALSYDLHYDYDHREVVTDGHGAAIDRSSQLLLTDAIASLTERLGAAARSLPLHEQMLYAGLAMLEESGGMPLMRTTFTIDAPEVDKSLGNDGVTCIERGVELPRLVRLRRHAGGRRSHHRGRLGLQRPVRTGLRPAHALAHVDPRLPRTRHLLRRDQQ